MAKEEENAFGISERVIVREKYVPVKEAERWRMGKSALEGESIVMFVH